MRFHLTKPVEIKNVITDIPKEKHMVKNLDGTLYITKDEISSIFTPYYDYANPSLYKPRNRKIPEIKNVIFNDPATIVFWDDGTKTVVKKQKEDKKKKFDKEKGLAMAIAKKALGNTGRYFDEIKMWTEPYLGKNKDNSQVLSDDEEVDYTNVY